MEDLIGRRIKEIREGRGWTQYRLAKEAGVQPSTISQIESGTRKKPSIDVLEKVADALSVTVGTLLGQKNEKEETHLLFRKLESLSEEEKDFIKRQIDLLTQKK
jgi:transcriptional regulator with XRE-family HTH domain